MTTQEKQSQQEEQRQKEMRILKKKLKAEMKAREELEALKKSLEVEIENERLNMIPSSSLEELEEAFNNSKNMLELELSIKEEELRATKNKVQEEEKVRMELQRELELLKEKIRMTEIQTESSLIRAHTKSRERRETEAIKMAKPKVETGWVKSKPKHADASYTQYVPKKGDEIDMKLAEVLNILGYELPLQYVKNGTYKFAGKLINMRILNGYLVIRVGGGYMKFDEWFEKYGKKEGVKIVKEPAAEKSGSFVAGVHVRRGGSTHTFALPSAKSTET